MRGTGSVVDDGAEGARPEGESGDGRKFRYRERVTEGHQTNRKVREPFTCLKTWQRWTRLDFVRGSSTGS